MNERTRLKALALLSAACVAALLIWRARPARVVAGEVTAVAGGAPPVAHLSLEHSRGRPPANVIVDVLDGSGELLGSQTLPGGRSLVEVPLHRTAPAYRVRVTAFHRLPWGVQQRHNHF